MILLSLTPKPDHCKVRVYSCAQGSRARLRMVDAKFNRVPTIQEIIDLQRRPFAVVAMAQSDDAA